MKKIATYLGLGLATLIIGGAGIAYAQGGVPWSSGDQGLVDRLVEKFSLNQAEVSQVVEQYQKERGQEMKKHGQEMLNQAVKDGKITTEQKEAIEQKREELQKEAEGKTWEERQDLREKHREEMDDWREENGIDLPIGPGLGHRGMHQGQNN